MQLFVTPHVFRSHALRAGKHHVQIARRYRTYAVQTNDRPRKKLLPRPTLKRSARRHSTSNEQDKRLRALIRPREASGAESIYKLASDVELSTSESDGTSERVVQKLESNAATPASQSRPRSATRNRDFTKKKVALIVGYDGSGYHGLQRNKGVLTVSDIFEKALHEAGAISDDNCGYLEKIQWQVAARTDKGVCAAGNVVSVKLQFNREEYQSGEAFRLTTERVNKLLPDRVQLFGIRTITGSFSARSNCGERWYEYLLPLKALPSGASLEEFDQLLQTFEGTHAFHNYTAGIDHNIPPRKQALRYITKCSCETTPIRLSTSEEEWIRIRICGQSFMLHQIRKMVSIAILTCHGRIPEDSIGRSFSRSLLINVAPAPPCSLFLDSCLFNGYNQRHVENLGAPFMVSDFDDQREAFKFEHILPSIARRSVEEDSLQAYFNTVEVHPPRFDQ